MKEKLDEVCEIRDPCLHLKAQLFNHGINDCPLCPVTVAG